VPTEPVELVFYNATTPDHKNIIYRVAPVVMRNLQFPVLLSWKDLKKLKANINIETNVVTMRHKLGSSFYPLVGAPRKPSDVHLCEDVIIPPGSEHSSDGKKWKARR